MKPGLTPDENPHHFVVIQVDGGRLSLEVIGTGATEYPPYGGLRSTIELSEDVMTAANRERRTPEPRDLARIGDSSEGPP